MSILKLLMGFSVVCSWLLLRTRAGAHLQAVLVELHPLGVQAGHPAVLVIGH